MSGSDPVLARKVGAEAGWVTADVAGTGAEVAGTAVVALTDGGLDGAGTVVAVVGTGTVVAVVGAGTVVAVVGAEVRPGALVGLVHTAAPTAPDRRIMAASASTTLCIASPRSTGRD